MPRIQKVIKVSASIKPNYPLKNNRVGTGAGACCTSGNPSQLIADKKSIAMQTMPWLTPIGFELSIRYRLNLLRSTARPVATCFVRAVLDYSYSRLVLHVRVHEET